MNEARYWIFGTPEQVRESIPEFDRPVDAGPFLVVEFEEKQLRIFERAAVMRMLGGFLYELDQLLLSREAHP